jgi:hypothetical protein
MAKTEGAGTYFAKRVTIDKDVVIDKKYPDSYYGGNATTAEITGGNSNTANYLVNFKMPSSPPYGSAKFLGFDLEYYVNDLNFKEGNAAVPELAIYKLSDNTPTMTEGGMAPLHANNSDMVIFSAGLTGAPTWSENFRGTSNAGPDAGVQIIGKYNKYRTGTMYFPLDTLWQHARVMYVYWGTKRLGPMGVPQRKLKSLTLAEAGYSKQQIEAKFCTSLKDKGGTTVIGCTSFEHQSQPSTWDYKNPAHFQSGDGWQLLIDQSGTITDKIYIQYTHIESTNINEIDAPHQGERLTSANSMFERVRHGMLLEIDPSDIGKQNSTHPQGPSADIALIQKCESTILDSGGRGCKMEGFANSSRFNVYRGDLYPTKTTSSNHRDWRQETWMCKTNIPVPIKLPAYPSDDDQDKYRFASTIEIDVDVSDLEYAYESDNYDSSASIGTSGLINLRRAFIITFSEDEPPTDRSQGFTDMIADVGPSSGTTALANFEPELTATTASVKVMGDGTGHKNFAAVAIVRIRENSSASASYDGWAVIPVNGCHDVSNPGWYYSPETNDVWISKNDIRAVTDEMLDLSQGPVRLTFMMDPDGYGITGGFARLLITDPATGSIYVSNFHKASGANTYNPHLDVKNIAGNKPSSANSYIGNWCRHMTLWLTHCPNGKNRIGTFDNQLPNSSVDTHSKVYVENIELKNFNFAAANCTSNPINTPKSNIVISNTESVIKGHDTAPYTSGINDNIASYEDTAPCVISFGFENFADLNAFTSAPDDRPYTQINNHIYLQGFSCSNPANLAEVPPANQRAAFLTGREQGRLWGSLFTDAHYDGGGPSWGVSNESPILIDEHANADASWADASKLWSKYAHIGGTVNGATSTGATTHVTSALGTGATYPGYYVSMPVGATMKLGADTDNEGSDVVVTGVSAGVSNAMTFTHNATDFNVNDGAEIFHKLEAGHHNFTRKGFFGYSHYATDADTQPHKRENIAASCRVKEIEQTGISTFDVRVDNIAIFLNNDDTSYCLFKYAHAAPSTTYFDNTNRKVSSSAADIATDLKVVGLDKNTNTVSLSWENHPQDNGEANNGTILLTETNLPMLFISPYKYWLVMTIDAMTADRKAPLLYRDYAAASLHDNVYTDTDGNKRLSWGEGIALATDLTNDFIDGGGSTGTAAVANRTNFGASFNEYLINFSSDGNVNGRYVNSWYLTPTQDGIGSNIESGNDYGFGEFDLEKGTKGYAGKDIANLGFNNIEVRTLAEHHNFNVNDDISLMLCVEDELLKHQININTREKGFTTDKDPAVYAIYFDEIPERPALSVKPNKENPMLPEFEWEAKDDDLWYGLLIVSDKNIENKYHNRVMHWDLNEDKSSDNYPTRGVMHKVKTDAAPEGTENGVTPSANVSAKRDGIAGYAMNNRPFRSGTNSSATQGDTSYGDSSNDPFSALTTATPNYSKYSILGHFIFDADTGATSSRMLLDSESDGPFRIYKSNLGPYITAQVRYETGSYGYAQVTSTSAIPLDGETPVMICVTVDSELTAGNVKLYINGKLEAESGPALADASGTVNSWERGQTLLNTTNNLVIGDGHYGSIEELTFYNDVVYPVVPTDGKFILTKPLEEYIAANDSVSQKGTALTQNARLFMMDYHNIRGTTVDEVAASSMVSWRKAAFKLTE